MKTENFLTKLLLSFILLLTCTAVAFGHGEYESGVQQSIQGGIGLGSVLAVVASWERNKSFLWAILHAIFGWLYVIYYVLTRNNERRGRQFMENK